MGRVKTVSHVCVKWRWTRVEAPQAVLLLRKTYVDDCYVVATLLCVSISILFVTCDRGQMDRRIHSFEDFVNSVDARRVAVRTNVLIFRAVAGEEETYWFARALGAPWNSPKPDSWEEVTSWTTAPTLCGIIGATHSPRRKQTCLRAFPRKPVPSCIAVTDLCCNKNHVEFEECTAGRGATASTFLLVKHILPLRSMETGGNVG